MWEPNDKGMLTKEKERESSNREECTKAPEIKGACILQELEEGQWGWNMEAKRMS